MNDKQPLSVTAHLHLLHPPFFPTPLRVNMKVTLKEWNAIATWHWDMPEDEVCGICRVQFDGTCPTCKFPGDDCALRESTRFRFQGYGLITCLQFSANVAIRFIW